MPVGWNWTNSMSELASPARATIAVPSPVQVWAEVQLEKGVPVNGQFGRFKPEKSPPISARGQDSVGGVEAVDAPVLQVHGHHTHAAALAVHEQVEGEVLDEVLAVVLERGPVERVQQGMARPVGHTASPGMGSHGIG
jgi:hypothetical protein